MPKRKLKPGATVRATARGLVAAMAMTGVRTVTASVAPRQKSPPQAIVEKYAPAKILRWQSQHRESVIELLHWTYGAAGGAVFGLLPDRVRRLPVTGPAYGLAIWLGFELAIAPALGVQYAQQRRGLWRAVVALDHVLYGLVVAGRLAPEPEVVREEAEDQDL
jgi:hypothetical protein